MKPHNTLSHARPLALLALTLLLPPAAAAQEEASQYDRGTPPQHAAGVAAAGGYVSADLGTVNLSNGSLNFSLPLGRVGGRGFSLPLTLNYSSKVWSAATGTDIVNEPIYRTRQAAYAVYDAEEGRPDIYQQVAPGWTLGAVPILRARGVGISPTTNNQCGTTDYLKALTKLTVILPDKGEVELRDDATDGSPLGALATPPNDCRWTDGNRGQRWHASDGSGIVFVSDAPNGVVNGDLNGWLVTADGTRYRFADTAPGYGGSVHLNQLARATLVRDRHGNQVQIAYTTSPLKVTYTDQLGRRTTVEYNVTDPLTQETLAVRVTLPGFGGQPRQYRIKTGVMNQHYRAGVSPALPVYNGWVPGMAGEENCGSAPAGATQLFTSWCGGGERIDDKQVLTQLVLPDDRSLRFRYNEFGEVAEVEMPTGGRLQYDYAYEDSLPAGNSPAFEVNPSPGPGNVRAIDRAVVARHTYPDGVSAEAHWSYAYSATIDTNGGATNGVAEVVARAADNSTVLLRRKHCFLDGGRYLTSQGGTGYSLWSTGLERRAETLSADGTAVLAASEQDWSQRAAVVWSHGYASEQVQNDNRVGEERKTLDTGAVAKVGYSYDQYNNPLEVREYDYDQSLKRRTVTSYLSAGNGYNYRTDDSIRLLRLPALTTVYDGAGNRVSETSVAYDEAAYPVETYGTVAGWSAPETAARGNATTVSRWLDASNSWLSTHARYDQVGNVRYAWDAKGNQSQVSYADSFSDGISRNTYTFATQTTSAVPDPSNQRGANTPLTASSVYDYSTGLVSSTTDANGKVTRLRYDDPFNRLTRVERPDGGWTQHGYGFYPAGSPSGSSFVETTAALDASRSVYSAQTFDGLGRPARSFLYDGAQYQTADTQYDALGRVRRTSHPYLSGGSGAPVNPSGRWTTTAYDALGRVQTVTTPDGAAVTTSYSGNQVKVTDQAGKSRRSVTDALGRLTRVVEDPNDLAYQTDYAYDALGNLRKVSQGGQLRYFMYDSLSRLVRARNPEQAVNAALDLADTYKADDDQTPNREWTLGYSYDANSNLSQRTDARNVLTTYSYDSLNRNTAITYANDPQASPAVDRYYDGGANGRGRLWWDKTAGAWESQTGYGYDVMGRISRRWQYFKKSDGTWSQQYLVSRVYDLAGNVTSQTYASGRASGNGYDAAGRLASFTGNLGDGTQRAYSTGAAYDEAGRLTREQFGTQTALYHKRRYNARGQLFDVRLGLSADVMSCQRGALVFDYGTTTNNGNLGNQQVWIPADEAAQSWQVRQSNYAYDQLNRVGGMQEFYGAGVAAEQWYSYDRWGNRQINEGATSGGVNNRQFAIDAGTNRLGVPAGEAGVMQYDAAGNLTNDTYTGAGGRTYDADGKMTAAWGPGPGGGTHLNRYGYDADGKRVRRQNEAGEWWQVYGFDGELLGEYAANASPSQPQKEYAYRGGELLVVAESNGQARWLVSDHLGTPRMTADQTGSLAGIRRHDYLPFGEELVAGTGGRTQAQGYAPDNLRQKFTAYERDTETGLDFAEARYYNSLQGRFSSPDPLLASALAASPQTWNRYSYVANRPLSLTDPTGMIPTCQKQKQQQLAPLPQEIKDMINSSFGPSVRETTAGDVAIVVDSREMRAVIEHAATSIHNEALQIGADYAGFVNNGMLPQTSQSTASSESGFDTGGATVTVEPKTRTGGVSIESPNQKSAANRSVTETPPLQARVAALDAKIIMQSVSTAAEASSKPVAIRYQGSTVTVTNAFERGSTEKAIVSIFSAAKAMAFVRAQQLRPMQTNLQR